MARHCEAPRCQQEATHGWHEPGVGVTWQVCTVHLARYVLEQVLLDECIELRVHVDEHERGYGWRTVYVVRSWNTATALPAVSPPSLDTVRGPIEEIEIALDAIGVARVNKRLGFGNALAAAWTALEKIKEMFGLPASPGTERSLRGGE